MSSDKSASTALMIVAAILTIPVLMLITNALNGWVLAKLWMWFIVPTFHLPPLRLWTAVGVSLVVYYLTDHRVKGEDRKLSESIALAIVGPFFVLAFGWMVHWLAR